MVKAERFRQDQFDGHISYKKQLWLSVHLMRSRFRRRNAPPQLPCEKRGAPGRAPISAELEKDAKSTARIIPSDFAARLGDDPAGSAFDAAIGRNLNLT